MRFNKTPIPGVILIEPQSFGDPRGFFMETWHALKFRAAGIDANFVQDNHSGSSQWTLRGMHMQVERPQGKLVRVTSGSVFDVVVDLRTSSTTFGQWWGTELSSLNRHMVWLPAGLAHGVLVMSSGADLVYKCTDFFSPELERTLAWDDPTVGIRWPLPNGVIPTLSSKDRNGRSFAEIEKFK